MLWSKMFPVLWVGWCIHCGFGALKTKRGNESFARNCRVVTKSGVSEGSGLGRHNEGKPSETNSQHKKKSKRVAKCALRRSALKWCLWGCGFWTSWSREKGTSINIRNFFFGAPCHNKDETRHNAVHCNKLIKAKMWLSPIMSASGNLLCRILPFCWPHCSFIAFSCYDVTTDAALANPTPTCTVAETHARSEFIIPQRKLLCWEKLNCTTCKHGFGKPHQINNFGTKCSQKSYCQI